MSGVSDSHRPARLYLIRCTSGMQDVVVTLLERDLGDLSVVDVEDGLVCVSCRVPSSRITRLYYVSNCFVVLSRFMGRDVAEIMKRLTEDRAWGVMARGVVKEGRQFRLVLGDGNRLVGGGTGARDAVIEAIESECKGRYSPRGGGLEFWILRRNTGRAYFCVRLSKRRVTEKDLLQGQLRPELTELLCELSEPTAEDVFLDPFSGSGAIVYARVRHPYSLVFAFDKVGEKTRAIRKQVKVMRNRVRLPGGPVVARTEDAREMASLEDGFVDRVVTDPPWGSFDVTIGDLENFYNATFREIRRVTKVGAVIVLLLGRTEEGERAVARGLDGVELVGRYDVLVAGRKAMVVKWRRVAEKASGDYSPRS